MTEYVASRRPGLTPLPVILSALLMLVTAAAAQALPRDVRTNLISATVQVIPWDDAAGDFAPWSGSGTIISTDGYVLTNYHVIGHTDSRDNLEWHGILMTDVKSADLPPQLTYWARFVAGDPLLDLAVLRIEELPDETPVPAGTVFPAVPVGDSNTLLPGDSLTVVGYPGISGSTITFTQGIMSGWLGEDQTTGGRQWIKTDAKITGGNSGGAAVNERGELVGIPTAGSHVLDGAVYEEQLYIRPIALAWALIGPHVPNVFRPDSSPVQAGPGTQSQVSTQPAQPPVQQSPETGGVPSGNQGALAIGQSVTRTAASASEEFITWHAYAVSVPAGQPTLTITVTSDDDIDFAYSFGRDIENWNDVDYLNDSPDAGGSSTVQNPPAGILNIDVLNAYARPISYTISISGSDQAQSAAVPPESVAPAGWPEPTPWGHQGVLTVGRPLAGNLQQDPTSTQSTYHSYEFDVPAGAAALTVTLDALGVLDLALKHGSPISSYAEIAEGGDWQYWEWGPDGGGLSTLQVAAPQPGRWYLDIVNYGNQTSDGRYTLQVDVR